MAATLAERVNTLEAQVAQIMGGPLVLPQSHMPEIPWWEKISGTFDDDPLYEEAMALGRAYRESLRPEEEQKSSEKAAHS